jgi:hypothetical protein
MVSALASKRLLVFMILFSLSMYVLTADVGLKLAQPE